MNINNNNNKIFSSILMAILFFLSINFVSADSFVSVISQSPEVISIPLDKAYPGIEYNIRLGVIGGKYPYKFSLENSPNGMTIDSKGEISWIPSSSNENKVFNVKVKVVDDLGQITYQTYDLTVTKNGFVFVDTGGNDQSGSGSISSPYKTINHAINKGSSTDILYIRGGNYAETISYDSGKIDKWLAYPNEHPKIDLQLGTIGVKSSGLYVDGLEIYNIKRWLFSVGGKSNLLLRRNHFHHIYDPSTSGNPAFVFFWDGYSDRNLFPNLPKASKYNIFQDNVIDTLYDRGSGINGDNSANYHGSSITMYDVAYSLVEDNKISNIDGNCINDKDNGYKNTIRGNFCKGNSIHLSSQWGQSNIEVSNNIIFGGAVKIAAQPGSINNIDVYSNTIVDGSIFFNSNINRDDSHNFNIYNNVIINDDDFLFKPYPGDAETAIVNGKIDSDYNYLQTSQNYVSGFSWGTKKRTLSQWNQLGYDLNSLYNLNSVFKSDGYTTKEGSALCGAGLYGDDIGAFLCDSPTSTPTPSPTPTPEQPPTQPVVCTTGQTKSCSTGLSGICSTGTQTCSNNAWGSCTQTKQATTEICGNNLDDDCDGSVDEGCEEQPVNDANILYSLCGDTCSTGANSKTGWVRTIETDGCYSGECLKLTTSLNSGTGLYGAGNTMMSASGISGKDEITVQYYTKFSESMRTLSGANIKSIRPYVGDSSHYFMGTISGFNLVKNNDFRFSYAKGTVKPTSFFDILDEKDTYVGDTRYSVSNGDGTWTINGQLAGKFNQGGYDGFGTQWTKVTQWIKLPSTPTGNDGESKLWVNGELLFHLYDASMSSGSTSTFSGFTFYPSSEAREPFEHWMDEMVIYEGYVPPTSSSTPVTSCNNGQTKSCSTGLSGICSTGTQTCSNNVWGSCIQTKQATTEICGNGIDEDCNGYDLNCDASSGNLITVDSIYNGYSIDKINDGIIDKTGSYAQGSFATAETNTPHWIEFNLENNTQINKLTIHWAYNGQRNSFMSSQEVQIQNWDGNSFVTIATITNTNSIQNSSISFDTITTKRFRLYQPANKGNKDYSTVLWVSEIDYAFETTNVQIHKADTDKNGKIDFGEILISLSKWQNNEYTFKELIEVIKLWRRS